ncbi:MAG: OmpA family protein [Saprospiraceae bacterium]|nr:OmpA family protein [Saprospiraceae bacterium]
MKKQLFLIFCLLVITQLIGQDPAYKRGLGFKTLFLDYQSQNGGNLEAFKDYHHGFEISFLQKISKGLYANFPVKYGTVETFDETLNKLNKDKHKQIVSLDGQLQFHFHNGGNNIVPYLMAGVGGVMEFDGEFNLQVPLGVGINFRAAKNAYINIQSEYRYSFLDNRNNLQHGLGFIYLIGGAPKDTTAEEMKMKEEIPVVEEKKMEEKMPEKAKDSDGDGIEDKLDLCPDQKGGADQNGCPDSDGDGVPDFQDNCPGLKGNKEMKGCPDSDGDGVADNEDECPNLAGAASNKGCPYRANDKAKDTDSDGIPDTSDRCPDQAGPADNGGCPKAMDRDMDGVDDSVDQCPDVKGSPSAKGCPDRDGDGISDPDDKCPGVKGPASLMGCPDSDNDGIADADDRCPDKAGAKSTNGCPDSDGDGLDDSIDKCPKAPGLKVYGGCPDSDGDGLDDSIDKCPNTPGTVASNGCPDITVEDRKTLDVAMRAVQFETGKATLKSESFTILKQIGSIMNRYPDYNLVIAGHTDNTGSSIANQELSEKRAKACHDYLLTQGIGQSRMSFIGYGESRPVSDNETENGRTLNRRVEFNLNPK